MNATKYTDVMEKQSNQTSIQNVEFKLGIAKSDLIQKSLKKWAEDYLNETDVDLAGKLSSRSWSTGFNDMVWESIVVLAEEDPEFLSNRGFDSIEELEEALDKSDHLKHQEAYEIWHNEAIFWVQEEKNQIEMFLDGEVDYDSSMMLSHAYRNSDLEGKADRVEEVTAELGGDGEFKFSFSGIWNDDEGRPCITLNGSDLAFEGQLTDYFYVENGNVDHLEDLGAMLRDYAMEGINYFDDYEYFELLKHGLFTSSEAVGLKYLMEKSPEFKRVWNQGREAYYPFTLEQQKRTKESFYQARTKLLGLLSTPEKILDATFLDESGAGPEYTTRLSFENGDSYEDILTRCLESLPESFTTFNRGDHMVYNFGYICSDGFYRDYGRISVAK